MEKERYELQEVFEDGSFHWYLKDNDTRLLKSIVDLHNCVDLLNQQEARIKELEEEIKRLFSLTQLNDCVFCEKESIKYNQMLIEENQQLKQSQNQNAIEELEKLKTLLEKESKENPIIYDIDNDLVAGAIDRDTCFNILNKQIKELRCEENG